MRKGKVFTAIVLWLLLTTMFSGCGGSTPAAIIHMVVSETLVTQVADLPSYGSWIAYSPDARWVAYVADRGGKKYVVVDGVPSQKGYDSIGTGIALSPDTFSPDGKRVAYIGITYGEKRPAGDKWFVVIDGEEGDAYSNIDSVTFSPDSKHVAYKANGLVFLDRVPVKGALTVPLFSPDSQHLVYVVEQSGKQSVVVDGVPGKPYVRIGAIAFSPDSKHVAYWALTGIDWVMVVDGREEGQYGGTGRFLVGPIVFSPDSNHLAYVAPNVVVLDGKELTRRKGDIYGLVFSPDSKHLAYGGEDFIVVDGVEKAVRSTWSINTFTFSPDSTRHVYIDIKRGWFGKITAEWVVVDGVKGKTYRRVSEIDITFSPDSKHIAYIAGQGAKAFVIVDEIRGKEYGPFELDMGSWGLTWIVWDSPDRFHYLVHKGNSIYLVEETLTEQ